MKKMILVLLLATIAVYGCKKAEAPVTPEAPAAVKTPAGTGESGSSCNIKSVGDCSCGECCKCKSIAGKKCPH